MKTLFIALCKVGWQMVYVDCFGSFPVTLVYTEFYPSVSVGQGTRRTTRPPNCLKPVRHFLNLVSLKTM
jgi:hypothetical protein